MKRLLALILVFVVGMLVLTGCSSTKYKDGTYTTSAANFDERGWKPTITITIKSDKLTDVKYDEVNKDGAKKSEDKAYNDSMKKAVNTNPAEAYPKLDKMLIDKQDPTKVDNVSGATHAATSFKQLATEALTKAKK